MTICVDVSHGVLAVALTPRRTLIEPFLYRTKPSESLFKNRLYLGSNRKRFRFGHVRSDVQANTRELFLQSAVAVTVALGFLIQKQNIRPPFESERRAVGSSRAHSLENKVI
jgi:hypothetical protein